MRATPADRAQVDKLFAALDAAGDARRRRLQRQLPHARAVRRTRSGRGARNRSRHRLRRLPGGAGGRANACCRAGRGAILFTGASASVKGYAQSAPFAMGKFALRGLAQSMARELSPQGIHVAHFVIDGGIAQRAPRRCRPTNRIACSIPTPSRRAICTSSAAAQRLDAGGRAAALGGEVLSLSADHPDHGVPVHEGLCRARRAPRRYRADRPSRASAPRRRNTPKIETHACLPNGNRQRAYTQYIEPSPACLELDKFQCCFRRLHCDRRAVTGIDCRAHRARARNASIVHRCRASRLRCRSSSRMHAVWRSFAPAPRRRPSDAPKSLHPRPRAIHERHPDRARQALVCRQRAQLGARRLSARRDQGDHVATCRIWCRRSRICRSPTCWTRSSPAKSPIWKRRSTRRISRHSPPAIDKLTRGLQFLPPGDRQRLCRHSAPDGPAFPNQDFTPHK